jgi:flavin reductase (DIM6/NTAB) family NADH-FMN oxidoreductase RutF
LPLDKWQWSPSPLPGQVVLVTSRDSGGVVGIAPKSWLSVAAMTPLTIGFGCALSHQTARNVRDTGEFVVNVPGADLAETIWAMPEAADRWAGLTRLPGVAVEVPSVLECAAHLECVCDRIVEFHEGEVFIFGTVLRIAVVEQGLAGGDTAGRYAALGHPFFFLENGWCAPLGEPRRASHP